MIRESYLSWTTKHRFEKFLITKIRIITKTFWNTLLKTRNISIFFNTTHSRDSISSFLSTNCIVNTKTTKSIKMKSLSNSCTLDRLSFKIKLYRRSLMTKIMRHKQRQTMNSKFEQYWKTFLLKLFSHFQLRNVSFVFENDMSTNDLDLTIMKMSETVMMQTIKSNWWRWNEQKFSIILITRSRSENLYHVKNRTAMRKIKIQRKNEQSHLNISNWRDSKSTLID